ncbi:BREX-2 system adenine-specific DNA-methyltransferase PglX [Rathayibacter sp. AY2B9]|uniref:BREX-2 system adenine-specific DNA-methyltransferase PglX n=1 Tax=Rathayibacter sp. AY2B9 TaxID=2080572 RepID=UPI001CA501CF|nr:BREX-2 system adenine-specific DNA-methyltransferase PglX [Rathayibacter sp. AY2B9]
MIDSALLLADLKRQLKLLEADLRARADDVENSWGARLREEHDAATRRERTGLAWIAWRDGEVAQAAVSWILASVFIRFAEDNGLLAGAQRNDRPIAQPWFAAPGEGLDRAVENEAAFYAASPTMTSRDWMQNAFRALADLPAGRTLVDQQHSAVWHAPISADASDGLLAFFRRTTPSGELVHDFSDAELGTRFLGDLYQDLSDYAKKTYALLQTPDFIEEFILDHTLTPAIAEFGLTGLKLIDPACGSGHFLLGAFERLTAEWAAVAPGLDKGERVQRALDSVHGVDLNPFAVAIARFRLTVAAIKAAGIPTLTAAPAFRYRLAIGDSLLGSVNQSSTLDLGDGEYFEYDTEDLRDYTGILTDGQYHVVVANPPYIQPPDAKLRDQYRALYSTCHGKYALSVPFMELLFRLAKRQNGGGAGYVGQITSNSFMKREFGKKLITNFLSGRYTGISPEYVDLTHVIDTSGAYIPGHGTPTVIVIGRPRRPQAGTVRAALGVRGEPGQPEIAAKGRVWSELIVHFERPGYNGTYVSIADLPRSSFTTFPWSLSGGGSGALKEQLESSAATTVGAVSVSLGITSVTGEDSFYMLGAKRTGTRLGILSTRPLVEGESIRDYELRASEAAIWPYSEDFDVLAYEAIEVGAEHLFWQFRNALNRRRRFGTPMLERGLTWWEWQELYVNKLRTQLTITFAFVATHNHFVLDRGGKVFKQSAPVIKLPEGATEDDHYDLLGVLNSSTACFWLKQVSQNKGNGGIGGGIGDEAWEPRYEFTGTKLDAFPLPIERSGGLARRIDELARVRASMAPKAVLSGPGPSAIPQAEATWLQLGRELVALQEELDWRTYVAYGLVGEELAFDRAEAVEIDPNERVFEIRLARELAAGTTQTSWFDRHRRKPLTALPGHLPESYRDVAERRLAAIETIPFLRLLEQPEYKRRWAVANWEELLVEATQNALLDRLEAAELWRDASGRPLVRSAAQVADELRRDEQFRELLVIHAGSQDFDLTVEVGKLLALEAVPALAALRYKMTGLEKFHEWERVWELQRAEDRGELVEVPVPPKYKPADFLKTNYWSARGKLDVPKERFLSFPGSTLPDDSTALFSWAGWDHAERGQAISRLTNELSRAGAPDEQVIPLVGALIELEPWLKQWHDELDARSGVSPAVAISGLITTLLDRLGLGRDDIAAWRPPAPTRGRRSAS